MEKQNNSTRILRDANRSMIMQLIARHGPQLRNELCEKTGLTGAAISRIVRELIDVGLLIETQHDACTARLGRRSNLLTLNPEGALVFAVTISANRQSVSVYDSLRNELVLEDLAEIDFSTPQDALITIANSINLLKSKISRPIRHIAGVGVGIAAPANDFVSQDGVVNSDVLGWSDVPVAETLSENTGLQVKVETRASAILRAELPAIISRGSDRPFLVNVGVGVGTASQLQGELHWSGNGGFGRLSHVPHPDSDLDCYCGRKGCLEQSATGAAVVRDVFAVSEKEAIPFSQMGPKLAQASERAASGDLVSKKAFREAGRRMASGIDIAYAMFSPDLVILAGETGRQADYIQGLKRGLKELRSPIREDQFQISKASSAEASASIALDAFVYSGMLGETNKAA